MKRLLFIIPILLSLSVFAQHPWIENIDTAKFKNVVKATTFVGSLTGAASLNELLSNKTATISNSTTTYPNWYGVTHFGYPKSKFDSLMIGLLTYTGPININNTGANTSLNIYGHTVNTGINWSLLNGGNQSIQVNDALDASTATSDVAGAFMKWSTTGSNTNIDGLMLHLSAGGGGNHLMRALDAQNYIAGAQTLNLLDMTGTLGAGIESQGLSSGDNLGIYSIAGFAAGRNISAYFRAIQDPSGGVASVVNIGALAYAGHDGSVLSHQIGIYSALGKYNYARLLDTLNSTSSAIVADNGDYTTTHIAEFRRDSKIVGVIDTTGGVKITPYSKYTTTLTLVADTAQNVDIMDIYKANTRLLRIDKAGRATFLSNSSETSAGFIVQNTVNNATIKAINANGNSFALNNISSDNTWRVQYNGSTKDQWNNDGTLFLGGSGTGSAWLVTAAGTTTKASIKITPGTLLTTPTDGALEYNATNLSFTKSSTRYTVPLASGTSSQLIGGDASIISAGTNITISGGTISASGGVPSGTDGKIVGYADGGTPTAIGRLNMANAYSYSTPSTGGTVNLTNNNFNIINPSGTLVSLTVNLPSSPADGDVVEIKYTQNITTVTYGNGTVVDGITAPTAGGYVKLLYRSASTSWY